MTRVTVYSTDWCGYCERAKALLRARGLDYEEIRLDEEPGFRERLLELTGRWTVPQIVVDGTPIGGFRELLALDREGVLERQAPRAAPPLYARPGARPRQGTLAPRSPAGRRRGSLPP